MSKENLQGENPIENARTGVQTTPITLFQRDDGKRSIAMGACDDRVVIDDGERYEDHAVKTIWLPGKLSFEEVRQAYANAEPRPGKASGWLGGGSS